ncbi:MAG: hypothetical protein DRN01_04295 [Thermoplasmata archaeon]|nr:MAG: hypothetical protein DRN01_04295 [Thermoplasmata archaeon]
MYRKLIKKTVAVCILLTFMFNGVLALNTTASLQHTSMHYSFNSSSNTTGQNQAMYPVMQFIPKTPSWLKPEEKDEDNKNCGLPPEFNWRTYGGRDWTTPAKNQGGCGSCWAFAAVGALESVINIANFDAELDMDLSEQYILSCIPKAGSCMGGNSYLAFYYLISSSNDGNNVNGIIPEDCFPYKANDDIPCSDKCSDWREKLVRLSKTGYWNLDGDSEKDREFLKSKLIDYGPLVVYMAATNDFMNWGNKYHTPNSYYPDPGYEPSINHAVLLVGYKDDPSIPHGGYWMCKNSWGTNFGYNGFFNIEYGALHIDDYAAYIKVPSTSFNPIAGGSGPYEGLVNEPIQFYGYAIRGTPPYTYHWEFGDGTNSSEQNPVHVYTKTGNYSITLTVIDKMGSTYDYSTYAIIKTLGANANGPYIASTGKPIEFQGSVHAEVPSCSWHWDFGDGVTSEEQNPVHSYTNEGTYTVVLTVTYNNCSDKDTAVAIIENKKPSLKIDNPIGGIYINKKRILPFFVPVLIGGPTVVEVEALDDESGIAEVRFYIDNVLMYTDYLPPYVFTTWSDQGRGKHVVSVDALDLAGNKATAQRTLWRIL